MNLSANTLFHITPKLDFLIQILKKGFHPRYCVEEIGFFTPLSQGRDFLAQPMVCFCDIPISNLNQHIEKYGYYGIGMSKDWGMSKQVSPVTYVYPHSSTGDILRWINFKSYLMKRNDNIDQFIGLTAILRNYYKSIEGHMYKNGGFGQKKYNFYDEREWRYVPWEKIEELGNKNIVARAFLEKEIFENTQEREKYNTLIGDSCKLDFDFKDIKYLFVKNNQEKETLLDFIENEYMKDKNRIDIRELISKVHSLEVILKDI